MRYIPPRHVLHIFPQVASPATRNVFLWRQPVQKFHFRQLRQLLINKHIFLCTNESMKCTLLHSQSITRVPTQLALLYLSNGRPLPSRESTSPGQLSHKILGRFDVSLGSSCLACRLKTSTETGATAHEISLAAAVAAAPPWTTR